MASLVDGSAQVKVYFRSSSKHAKITHFSSPISTDQLYLFASRTHNISIDAIHLFLQGVLLPPSQIITLLPNSIVHIVHLQELVRESIKIAIKKLDSDDGTHWFQIDAGTVVRRFIDEKLVEVYGQGSSQIFLVHMGRQLSLESTFRQQEVENGSQILCLCFEPQQTLPLSLPKQQSNESSCQIYQVRAPIVAIGQLETPEAPKDIYPSSNFPITIPQGIETSNSLNLIFDSKVRRSSSIRNIDLDPNQVIIEEDSQAERTRRNQSYQSEHNEEHHPNESHFSEQWRRGESEGASAVQAEGEEIVDAMGKEVQFKAGDMIYAGDMHMLGDNNFMGALINSHKEKLARWSSHKE